MDEISIISAGYRELSGNSDFEVHPLPRSGSDRRYFRIMDRDKSVIGAYNANHEENEAFVGFTEHFMTKSLPVPEIFGYFPDRFIYFLKDLGDTNLYTWLHTKSSITGFDSDTNNLYRQILDTLVLFQTRGIEGLDLELCYPHKSFDRQSMMWDMNYFKYMFLKLIAAPFNERRLEHDFDMLADFLLEAGQDYFLYRDFQTANIMIVNNSPWFIDYQGGRRGAPQYDVASLLYDAKIPMSDSDRETLLEYYIRKFCEVSKGSKDSFRGYYTGFSMIRVMQALGAFGFRGLYEQKPTFTESIVPGVRVLIKIITQASGHINLPELFQAVRSIPETRMFKSLSEIKHP